MNKIEFLYALREALEENDIPNIDSMIEYYDEIICDRVEDGMSEEEAIASMDSIDTIIENAILEKPFSSIIKDKFIKKHTKAKESGHSVLWTILLVIGSPVWFPILLSLGIVAFCLYVVLWILAGVFFIVLGALALSSIACIIFPFTAFWGIASFPSAMMGLGAALVLGGATILLFPSVTVISKRLTATVKKTFLSIKKLFIKRG